MKEENGGDDGKGSIGWYNKEVIGREGREASSALWGWDPPALCQCSPDFPLSA